MSAVSVPGNISVRIDFEKSPLPFPWRVFWILIRGCTSVKKKEPKPKLFGPDIFRWGGGLPREGVGAKKFGMSLEAQANQTFWQDILEFGRDIPGVPEKFEKKI